MPTLVNGSGALRINVPRGSTLIIRNQSGVETVTGSSAAREDATFALGANAVVYGPQSASSDVSITTTGVLTYDIVSGDATPATDAVRVSRNAATGAASGLVDAFGQPVGGGGVVLESPSASRKMIANEEVTFLYNGNNPNDTAFPLAGLCPIADIQGAGVIDFINLICTANDAFRSAQLVVFVDGEVIPSINFQMSHFGLDYQPGTFTNGLRLRNQKMRLNLSAVASGISQAQVSFRYEIPFSTGCKVFIYQRQPIMKWWTEVAYRPGVTRPYRLKSKSTNNNGPTFARGGTTGFAAAASSFTSPIDNVTACALPSYINATSSMLKDGSISFMDVPSGKAGTLAGFSYGAFNPSADNFSYMETNIAMFSGPQKAAGINANSIAANYHSTGTEDFLGSSFYANEGIGSWGDYYISEFATTNNTNGPGASFARNIRCVVDFLQRYQNGIEFTDGAYLTAVQSTTNIVSQPSNATQPNNNTTQTGISGNISLSFLSLWYEFQN